MSGKSFPDAITAIYNRTVSVGGRRVIVIHLGTNGICYRTWAQSSTQESRLQELLLQAQQLFTAIRKYNSTCLVIFSAVLPRKCDWAQTKELCIAFNQNPIPYL